MENTLVFEKETQTIRQMPQNYLIAHQDHGRWVCEPDLAADKNLVLRVFCALFSFDEKYGDGPNLLAKAMKD